MKRIFIWLHIFLEPKIKLSSCVQKNVQSGYSETSDSSVARRPQRGVPKIAEKALLLSVDADVGGLHVFCLVLLDAQKGGSHLSVLFFFKKM